MAEAAMAPPALIAGFDAGQTHTTCRLAQRDPGGSWTCLAQGEGPGVRHLAAPGGPEAFCQALRTSLALALAASGLSDGAPVPAGARQQHLPGHHPLLAAVGIGASGIEVGSGIQAEGTRLAAEALQLPHGRLLVTGDERAALRGAMGTAPEGLVLISGTGTIAVGRNREGREHRCAGWGWLLDGMGSAMDIGRDGLGVSLEMADGRRPGSDLRRRLWDELGLDPDQPHSPQGIKALVVTPEFGPAGFARLAPVVVACAEDGDAAARAIVRRHAGALAAMAATIARELNLEQPRIWPMGGALEHLRGLRRQLELALESQLPQASLATPAGDACAGALALAVEQL
ncbi:N-acetylglucosamine kinase [Cyanobium sp. LEGE 06143]|nr:N-acetylglucosamine kinase [Cyanobium sp. LEGE 06143]